MCYEFNVRTASGFRFVKPQIENCRLESTAFVIIIGREKRKAITSINRISSLYLILSPRYYLNVTYTVINN